MDSLINKAKSIKQLNELNINGINKRTIDLCADELIKMIEENNSEISIPLKKSLLINYVMSIDIIIEKLNSIMYSDNLNAKLIYKVTRDGDKIKNFSDKCGNIKNTLIIIKTTENLIFGGFTKEMWGNSHADKKDDNAFCFSVNNKKIYESVRGSNSIFFYPGNIFGFFWFIDIKENSLTNGGSDHTPWCNGYYNGVTSRFELNEGKEDFKISEIECYQICP